MKLEIDEWLTRTTGCKSYRIVELNQLPYISKDDLTSTSDNGSAFFYVKIPVIQVELLHSFCKAGFKVIDVNISFKKELSHNFDPSVSNSDVIIRDYIISDDEMLLDIAENCFKYSRFHLDPSIPAYTANKIKREWVSNYLSGNRGDEIIIAEKDGIPVGFLAILHSYHNGERISIIDLICVDNNYQNRGIGKQMLSHYIRKVSGNFTSIHVGTQVANTPSMRFYEKCGFRFFDAAYVLHAHVKNGVIT